MHAKRLALAITFVVLSICGGASAASAAHRSPISIRIVLDTTHAKAGTPIHGTAILTNTNRTRLVVEACAYNGWLFVGLTNKSVTFDPAVTTVALCSERHPQAGGESLPSHGGDDLPRVRSARYAALYEEWRAGPPEGHVLHGRRNPGAAQRHPDAHPSTSDPPVDRRSAPDDDGLGARAIRFEVPERL